MADAPITRRQAKIEKTGAYPAGGTVNLNRPAPKFPARPAARPDDKRS